MSSIDELFRARDEFERTIQNQCTELVLAEEYLSAEKCPSRQELTPVLHSIQEMSKSLASFFQILNGILNDSDERSKLELLIFQEVMPNAESARNLMKPRHVLIPLSNAYYHNQTPTSLLWEQTFNLAIWYSEFRNTISGIFHIVENNIKGYFTDNKWLWNWMKDFTDERRITALYSIAKRAVFLQKTDDDEILAGEAVWWCEQLDSFPRISGYYGVFIGFLNHCPDTKNPLIMERLKEFSLIDSSDESEFIKSQQETIRGQALSLLNP